MKINDWKIEKAVFTLEDIDLCEIWMVYPFKKAKMDRDENK